MNCLEIIKEYLIKNGYDGLCKGECSCMIEDMVPCVDGIDYCEPGYRVPCDCGDGCDFHIVPEKEEDDG